MCGIAGIYSPSEKEIDKKIWKISNLLSHRGPDNTDTYVNKEFNFAFGSNRLSIIDLDVRSNQPLVSQNNGNIITFNGEIYNYKEIKKTLIYKGVKFYTNSDTEVLLEGYNYYGKEVLNHLEGMFSFVIWDKKKKIFFCARDHVGVKPFVYFLNKKNFIFCSEVLPIIKTFNSFNSINLESINNLYNYGNIFQPNTFFKDLVFLEPGHFLEINLKFEFKIESYWDISKSFDSQLKFKSYNDYVEQSASNIVTYVEKQLVSDVEIGNLLSGGLDSSVLFGISDKKLNKKVKNFNTYFKLENYDESQESKDIVDLKNGKIYHDTYSDNEIVKNLDKYISIIDQPSYDGFNTYLATRNLKNNTKICLSGIGADELFYGYGIHLDFIKSREKNKNLFNYILKKVHKYKKTNLSLSSYFLYMDIEEYFKKLRKLSSFDHNKIFNNDFMNEINFKNYDWNLLKYDSKNLDIKKRIFNFEVKHNLKNVLLRDSDVTSMANSIELRPVYLHHKLVEWAAKTIDYASTDYSETKQPIRYLYKKYFKLNYKKKKKGFELPFYKWMSKKDIKEKIIVFLEKDILLNKEYKRFIRKNINQESHQKEIFNFYVINSWMNKNNLKL